MGWLRRDINYGISSVLFLSLEQIFCEVYLRKGVDNDHFSDFLLRQMVEMTHSTFTNIVDKYWNIIFL